MPIKLIHERINTATTGNYGSRPSYWQCVENFDLINLAGFDSTKDQIIFIDQTSLVYNSSNIYFQSLNKKYTLKWSVTPYFTTEYSGLSTGTSNIVGFDDHILNAGKVNGSPGTLDIPSKTAGARADYSLDGYQMYYMTVTTQVGPGSPVGPSWYLVGPNANVQLYMPSWAGQLASTITDPGRGTTTPTSPTQLLSYITMTDPNSIGAICNIETITKIYMYQV